MSRKTLLNIDYALIQGTYWMFYAVAGSVVSVYMLGKGYSNTSIGLVIAVGNVVAVFVQAVLANITDKARRLTDITVIKVLIAVLFALTVVSSDRRQVHSLFLDRIYGADSSAYGSPSFCQFSEFYPGRKRRTCQLRHRAEHGIAQRRTFGIGHGISGDRIRSRCNTFFRTYNTGVDGSHHHSGRETSCQIQTGRPGDPRT